jgi:hypothetical protein
MGAEVSEEEREREMENGRDREAGRQVGGREGVRVRCGV